MSLRVVEDACNLTESSATVVLESDLGPKGTAIDELKSAEARKLAIGFAAGKGISAPGVSGSVHHYPVDGQGNPITELKQVPASYRATVPVTSRVF